MRVPRATLRIPIALTLAAGTAAFGQTTGLVPLNDLGPGFYEGYGASADTVRSATDLVLELSQAREDGASPSSI